MFLTRIQIHNTKNKFGIVREALQCEFVRRVLESSSKNPLSLIIHPFTNPFTSSLILDISDGDRLRFIDYKFEEITPKTLLDNTLVIEKNMYMGDVDFALSSVEHGKLFFKIVDSQEDYSDYKHLIEEIKSVNGKLIMLSPQRDIERERQTVEKWMKDLKGAYISFQNDYFNDLDEIDNFFRELEERDEEISRMLKELEFSKTDMENIMEQAEKQGVIPPGLDLKDLEDLANMKK